jgi:NAD dependent epimerase/dehydratase family enzyme
VGGPLYLCALVTRTLAEYPRAVSESVPRPAFLPAPKAILKKAAGPLASEVLGSVRAAPQVLLDAGHQFADHDVRDVLATALA